MAKTYTSTIELNVWKEHTCASCGAVYSYLFVRKVSGTGGTAEVAQINARKHATKVLAEQVDVHPCPTCGLIQPDMIAQKRLSTHRAVLLWTLIVLVILVIVRASRGMQANVATWAIVITCGVAALIHAAAELKNLNADTNANRQLAAGRVDAMTLNHTPGRAGSPREEWVNPPRGLWLRLALPMLLGVVLLAALPEIIRTMRGWPLNADSYPPVVGPGDTARIYMDQKIHSVKGYWRGTPEVLLHVNGSGDKGVPVTASTNQNDWGSTIYAKSDEKDTSSTPWVELQLPGDASLAGKTFDCDIDLILDYPKIAGSSNFQRQHEVMQRTIPLHFAPVGAGANFTNLWWEGTAGAIGLLLFTGIVLIQGAKALRQSALPTRLLQPAAPAVPQPPPIPQAPQLMKPPPIPPMPPMPR